MRQFTVLSATMQETTPNDGIGLRKHAPHVFSPRQNAPITARADGARIVDNFAGQSPKPCLVFLWVPPRSRRVG